MDNVEEEILDALTEGLLRWYGQHARPLPWRATKDPYPIFLSEIILQQTRVAQGTPYYIRFLETFPTVHNLAAASEDEVLRLWQGLGYYSRARNMLAAAKQVSEHGWPQTAVGLLVLPGIGPYTSAAIASLAFNEASPVVDGNVARVLARWFDLQDDIAKPATLASMRVLARQLMGDANPGIFNQAMMEFGAIACTPAKPDCPSCHAQDLCRAWQRNTVELRPVKAKARAKKERHLVYLAIFNNKNELLVKKRNGKGIWQGLYEFWHLEGDGKQSTFSQAKKALEKEWPQVANALSIEKLPLWEGTHILSHQTLYITVHMSSILTAGLVPPSDYHWVSLKTWETLGKPVPMVKATERINEAIRTKKAS